MSSLNLISRLFLVLLLIGFQPLWGKAQGKGFSVKKGLVYSEPEDSRLTLDLYLPEKPATPLPCIVVIQGGGFMAQTGQRFRPFAEHFAQNGFAAALISYRGRPDHTYKDTMEDMNAAVRFLRKNAESHHIDPSRIGAMGRSAGGTLAALLAVTAEGPDRIQAAAGIAGVYDFVSRFTSKEQLTLQPKSETKIQTNGEWIGSDWLADMGPWKDASAITHIDKSDPPLLLLHAKDDRTVPWMQSRDLHHAMIKLGIQSELSLSESGGHSGPKDSKEQMVNFFRKTLDHKAPPSN